MSAPEREELTPFERVSLINRWSDWFVENTGSWEGDLGMDIAYLFSAIAKDNCCIWPKDEPIVTLLRDNGIEPDNEIWRFIEIEEEE